MLNFGKLVNLKIILVIVALIVFLDSTVYGIDLLPRKHLRVPLVGTTESNGRVPKIEALTPKEIEHRTGISQREIEETVDKIITYYKEGTLNREEAKELLRKWNLDPETLDSQLLELRRKVVKEELMGISVEKVYEGHQAIIYEGMLHGNIFIIKDIKDDKAWERYGEGEEVLGDDTAGYILLADLKTSIGDKEIIIKRAIVQNKVTPLFEHYAQYKEDTIGSFIALIKSLIEKRILPKIKGFLLDYGINERGDCVVIEVGDLDFEIIKDSLDRFDLNNFLPKIVKDIQREAGYLDFEAEKKEVDPYKVLGKELMDELILDIVDSFNPENFKTLWDKNDKGKRVIYYGGYEIAGRAMEVKKDYLRDKLYSFILHTLIPQTEKPVDTCI